MQSRADNRDALDVAHLMRRALTLASATNPHPNPRVGALLVDSGGRIVAEAAHVRPGAPHAEQLLLAGAADAARGGTVVVTLEPCSHHGRTPPCADALISAGVARVVVGAVDPDERVAGSGIDRLRAAGVEVIEGVLAAEVLESDPGYFHHRSTGRPRVTLKLAATLDGQTAALDGTSQWITSDEARRDAHRLRAAADAIAVGAGTVRTDDPQLTVRLEDHEGSDPLPVVIAGRRPLTADSRVFSRRALVYAPGMLEGLPDTSEIVVTPSGTEVDLDFVIKDLGSRGILEVLVEGGPTLGRSLLSAGLVDRLVVYLAGAVAGGAGRPMFDGPFATLAALRRVDIISVARVGPDLRVEAIPTAEEIG